MLKIFIFGIIAGIQVISLGLLFYWFHNTKWRRIVLMMLLIAILGSAVRGTMVPAYLFLGGRYPLPEDIQDIIALAVLTVVLLCWIVMLHFIFKSLERITTTLKESESHFRGLIEQLPGIVCRRLNDDSHTLLYVSEAIKTLTGHPAEDFVEKRCSYAELIHPEDRLVFTAVQEQITAGEPYVVQYRLCLPDGDVIWVRERGCGIFGEAGDLNFLNCFISDVTKQVYSERLLNEQHKLAMALTCSLGLDELLNLCLQTAMHISGMDVGGIYVTDPENGSVRLACSSGLPPWFVREAGYYSVNSPKARLIMQGKPIYTCYEDNDSSENSVVRREGIKAAGIIPVKHGDVVIACINVGSHDLEQVPTQARSGLETLAGQVGQVIAHEQAQATTREREANLETLFASIRDMIFVLDADFHILRTNPAVSTGLGYAEETLIGRSLWTFIPERIREEMKRGLEEMDESRQSNHDGFFLSSDDREIPVGTSVVAGMWNGHPAYFAVACDLSERLQAEETRLSLERQVQLARRLESMGILAGGVAHDFNNLMTVILGNAELVRDSLGEDDPIRRRLDLIMQTTDHASTLCRHIMTYSGRGPLVTEIVHPNHFFQELQPLLRSVVAEHVWLDMKIGDDLPRVKGDPSQLRQVILNLVLNASEAIGDDSEGAVSLTISRKSLGSDNWKNMYLIPTDDGKEYLVIEVSDTGRGMDEETRKRLFDPFFTTKSSGRGLGMAAVLGIVRAHNGGIDVSSEVGKGSRFRLYLHALQEEPEISTQEESASCALSLESGDTILFVDDEEPLHDMCRIAGAEEGYRVLTAVNGAEALEQYRQYQRDIRLVVLDMTMPVMDGATAFRELRRMDPDVRVLIASGFSTVDHEKEFAGEQLIGVLHKPYSLGDLRNIFRSMKKTGPGE